MDNETDKTMTESTEEEYEEYTDEEYAEYVRQEWPKTSAWVDEVLKKREEARDFYRGEGYDTDTIEELIRRDELM